MVAALIVTSLSLTAAASLPSPTQGATAVVSQSNLRALSASSGGPTRAEAQITAAGGTTVVTKNRTASNTGNEHSATLAARQSSTAPVNILVMGDSYSAGNGAGSYKGASGCYRSKNNYANLYAAGLRKAPYSLIVPEVKNVACSGAVTNNFFGTQLSLPVVGPQTDQPPQLDAVNSSYDLILLTIGGNDAKFADIVKNCLVTSQEDAEACNGLLANAEKLLNDGTLKKRVANVLRRIYKKAANNNVKIVLLGYPQLEGDTNYTFSSAYPGKNGGPLRYVTAIVGKRIRAFSTAADKLENDIVTEANTINATQQFQFVSVQKLFNGPPYHGLYAAKNNSDRWMVQPFIDASLATIPTFYHPNPTGWLNEAQLLLNTLTLPISVPTTSSPSVAAGDSHSCAIVAGGSVRCWGFNGNGQLGDGTTTQSSIPVPVSGVSGATAIATGAYHSCAIVAGGNVRCWGRNAMGELGNGTTTDSSTPVPVSGVSGATAIAAGYDHSCAVVAGGSIRCWGLDTNGILGDGWPSDRSIIFSSIPVPVSGVSGATAIAAGSYHSCAIVAGGSVRCWGGNASGELGDGTTTDASIPVPVSGVSGATAIAAGFYHSCAIVAGGSVRCWGRNTLGQLGDGTTTDSSTPVLVSGVSGATAIAAGFYHSCAIVAGGSVRCWGYNGSGQLGNGTTTGLPTPVPVPVSGVSEATAIAAGFYYSCAIVAGGSVRCWGYNDYGQLGDGTTTDSSTPVPVSGM